MSLIRWNPLRDVTAWNPASDLVSDFAAMQREIDRLFDRFTHGGGREDGGISTWLPPVDIIEEENEFIVKVELPGMTKNDVKITVLNDVLTIQGEKKQEEGTRGKNYHRAERGVGMFRRSFALPSSVESENIEATYENGILTIAVPKLEEAKPKEIQVKIK